MNFFSLVIAAWQAWEARDIESEFSEGQYIGLSVFSLCQAFMTGIPIIAVVKDIPEAFYLVTVFLIFMLCLVVLSLVFLPKVKIQRKYAKLPPSEQRKMLAISVKKSALSSGSGAVVQGSSEMSSRQVSGLFPQNSSDQLHPGSASSRCVSGDATSLSCQYCGATPMTQKPSHPERRGDRTKRRYSAKQEKRLSESIQGFMRTGSLRLPSSDKSNDILSEASPASVMVSEAESSISMLNGGERGAPTIPEGVENNSSGITRGRENQDESTEIGSPDEQEAKEQTLNEKEDNGVQHA